MKKEEEEEEEKRGGEGKGKGEGEGEGRGRGKQQYNLLSRVFDSSSSSRKDVGVDWLERDLPEAVSWCLSPGTTHCKTSAGLEMQLEKPSGTK